MRAFLRTLLLIALLVQLPLSALAAYSDMSHSHEHQHRHEMGGHSHQHSAEQTTDGDESNASNDCGSHHHCGGTHLTAIPTSRLQTPLSSSRQLFGMSSDAHLPSAAHTRIERPNWATL
jgi:ABC-type Zn2+ transport system substrate-binding protein/surface adhesin